MTLSGSEAAQRYCKETAPRAEWLITKRSCLAQPSFYVSNLGKQTTAAVTSQLIPAQRGMDFDVAKYLLQSSSQLLQIQIFSVRFFATHLEVGNN